MGDLSSIREMLEGLAEALPGPAGLHAGLAHSSQAPELEIGQMLYGAVLEKKPSVVVEIGTGTGYSATWITLALEENEKGILYTFDPVTPMPPVWQQVGCPADRIKIMSGMVGDLWKFLPEKIDFIFHDASHNPQQVLSDIELLGNRISVGGIITVHDVNYSRTMGDALAEYFEAHPSEWSYQEFSAGCGLGAATRILPAAVPIVPKKMSKKKVKGAK